MALTLNGSTGITSANIADGTITNADINASAAIDASKLSGTGKVLQTYTDSGLASSHEHAGNTLTYTSTHITGSITTQAANSKILIMSYQGASHCQPGTAGMSWIQRTISGTDTQIDSQSAFHMLRDPGESGNNYYPMTQMYVDAPNVSAGTTITYSGRYKRLSGSNGFYYLHTDYGYGLTIMEIAQ